jgi:retinol dehydrogenase-12
MNPSRLILACRNLQKGEAAKASIQTATNCLDKISIEVWEVDLDHFSSVRAFCQRIDNDLDRIDGFIANAGAELMEYQEAEGLERTLTINVVSTFYMANAIYQKLQESAKKYNVDTNLSLVGSLIHYMAPDAQLDVPEDTEILEALSDAKTADMGSRYPLSKLVVHQVFAQMVQQFPAKEPGSHGVIVNLVNPGWCGTELGRSKEQGVFERVCFSVIGRTSEEGGRTLAHAVTAGRESDGEYLSECMVKPQSEYMRSEKGGQIGKRLFDETWRRLRSIDDGAAE